MSTTSGIAPHAPHPAPKAPPPPPPKAAADHHHAAQPKPPSKPRAVNVTA
jgi:hypothetical protein